MSEKISIMVVDDDLNIGELLRLYLEKEGYAVTVFAEGGEAVKQFQDGHFDLALLDIMLPGIDGYQILREIRKTSDIPVMMLTAKGETFDKVMGLDLGADDYVVKPFEIKEVLARIKALLRRTEPKKKDDCLVYPELEISIDNYELKVRGKTMDIPPKELELLYFMASHPNQVFTREQILDKVWGFDFFGESRTVDVHIKRLREKLNGISEAWQIKTVWSVGYKFEVR